MGIDMKEERREEEITRQGNPGKPAGEAGREMLLRMNGSHFEVTGWALGFWQIEESDQVLDIGCGGGATLHRMAKEIFSGHLTGVDYSPVSVETSSRTNEEEIKSGKMEILEASVEALPFSDSQFDKIITVESFYFWPDPVENLKEVLRVLKPDGTFLLVADIYQKEGLEERALENIRDFHLFNPSKEEFGALFKEAGFVGCQIHTKRGKDWICVEGSKK